MTTDTTTGPIVQPLGGLCGAEVRGVDLAQLDPQGWDCIQQAFRDHGVLVFREQTLTPEQHIAFAERFGRIEINKFFRAVEGYPEIAEVRKEKEQTVNIGGGWHTDHSYDAVPAMGSVLVARELPQFGGDTLFASMYAAYDSLSEGLKTTLEGLQAVHSSRHVFGDQGAYQQQRDTRDSFSNPEAVGDTVHPMVIRHPLSGRKALYVNPGFTTHIHGWTAEESRPLLEYLYRQAARPEHTCRLQWQPGSVALWDNRATWHYALNDYQGQHRLMHRITIEGSPLH